MDYNSYDAIAKEYRDSKQLPFRKYIEEYTLFQLAGDVAGLHLLDLACGEGIYTRKLKKAGCASILGVDLSKEMIALAEDSERTEPLGCHYLVHDVLTLQLQGQYDLVVAMYLLNYAQSVEELQQFCRVAFEHLKPGGRFIGFNDNPMNQADQYALYQPYGFIKETTPGRPEGAPVKYVIRNPDGTLFSFDNFYWHPKTYAAAFEQAGFVDFRWKGPLIQPDAYTDETKTFWATFMQHPPLIGFSANRPIGSACL